MTSVGGLEQFMGEISEGKKMFDFLVVFEGICSCIWVEIYHQMGWFINRRDFQMCGHSHKCQFEHL